VCQKVGRSLNPKVWVRELVLRPNCHATKSFGIMVLIIGANVTINPDDGSRTQENDLVFFLINFLLMNISERNLL
ncbi:MAG: hypothetical protein EA411_11415, partial [Saprospirales bacterium]